MLSAWNAFRLSLLLVLLGLIFYVVAVYIVPWVPAAAVAVYFVGAVCAGGAGLYNVRRSRVPRNAAEEVSLETAKGRTRRDTLQFIEFYASRLASILIIISTALVWPLALVVFGYALANPKDDAAPRVSFGGTVLTEHLESFGVGVWMMLAVAIAEISSVDDRYPRLVVYTLLAAVIVKQVALVVLPGGLPELIRRKTTQPYQAFLLILVLDAASLIVGCHYLRVSAAHGVADGGVGQTAALLLNTAPLVQRIIGFVDGQAIPQGDLAIGLVGLIFNLALIKNVLNIKIFRRTDGDYLYLAQNRLQGGHATEALRYLDCISKDHKNAPSALLLRSTALVVLCDFERAKPLAARAVEGELDLVVPVSEDEVFSILVSASMVMPVPTEVSIKLFKWLSESGASDWLLANLVDASLTVLHQTAKSERDVQNVARELEQVGCRLSVLPLTGAVLKLHLLEIGDVRRCLSEMRPNIPIESLSRRMILMLAMMRQPDTSVEEDRSAFSKWTDDNAPAIMSEVRELVEWNQKLIALGILLDLQTLATAFGHASAGYFAYLANMLSADLRKYKWLEVIVESLNTTAEKGLHIDRGPRR
jgi:hypothetical protein